MIEGEEFQNQFNEEKPAAKKNITPVIGFAIILIIGLSALALYKFPKNTQKLAPIISIPEVTSEPTPIAVRNISPLATDEAVLKTKKEIENNINTANTADLSESNLTFPILDFNIGFQ